MPHADRTDNWVRFARDRDTGIETIHAHFEGHAYDPHWHDTYAVGVTEQGVQRFHVGRVRHESVPGRAILLEPGRSTTVTGRHRGLHLPAAVPGPGLAARCPGQPVRGASRPL